MGFILEASGGFHWKCYSSVDITNGKALQKLRADGTPLRVQQSILLARKDEKYTSKSCWQVQELAVAKAKEIEAWEAAIGFDAYSDDVNGRFQRDVNGHSGHVNKVGAQRRWDYNHARHLRD
ncbi:MAG: hypothetical protein WCC71_22980 [Candidatus Sulfotelmatobacter sp.]